MNVRYESSFEKDLRKIRDVNLLRRVKAAINEVKQAKNVGDVNSLKKLKGFETFYRIKLGDYRIGIEVVRDEIIFTRFLHRKEVYRFFPK